MEYWIAGGVIALLILRQMWKAHTHPAQVLCRQAANMNWVYSGTEKDADGYKNSKLQRGKCEVIVSFTEENVRLSRPYHPTPFSDFIELEKWMAQSGAEFKNHSEQTECTEAEGSSASLEPIFDENFDFIELEDNISEVFSDFSDALKKDDKERILTDLMLRCNTALYAAYEHAKTLGALWSLDVRIEEQSLEVLVDRFGYALHMISSEFFERYFEEGQARETQRLYWSLEASIAAVAEHSIKNILGEQFKCDPMSYYLDYDEFDDANIGFWDAHFSEKKEIFQLRRDVPQHQKNFIYGFDNPDEDDIDDDGDIDIGFSDYAHIRPLIERLGKDSVNINKFLGDTKFVYTPIFVRYFFEKPDIAVLK